VCVCVGRTDNSCENKDILALTQKWRAGAHSRLAYSASVLHNKEKMSAESLRRAALFQAAFPKLCSA
jgi:hypothetical protein